MTLILDTAPWTPPAPVAPLSGPHSASQSDWTVYTRANPRDSLTTALTDSLITFAMTRNRVPTAILLHHENVALLAPVALEAGLLVYTTAPGGVRVQPGTWGLL